MLKKGLLIGLLFFIVGCSGAMRVAEENTKTPTTPNKNIIAKPNK